MILNIGQQISGKYFGKYEFCGIVTDNRYNTARPTQTIYTVRVNADMVRPGNGLLKAGEEFKLYYPCERANHQINEL